MHWSTHFKQVDADPFNVLLLVAKLKLCEFGHIVPCARPKFVELFRMREHRAKQFESCSLIWGLVTVILRESGDVTKTRRWNELYETVE
jgi:hypothetical protein